LTAAGSRTKLKNSRLRKGEHVTPRKQPSPRSVIPDAPPRRGRARSKSARSPLSEPLEPRVLFCLDHLGGAAAASLWAASASASAPASASATPAAPLATESAAGSGLPLLHSLPGATVSLFLDFDGYDAFLPYDSDGDPTSFSPSEQAEVREAWRHVASYFSMFNLDVTTERPAAGWYSYSLVSNSVGSASTIGTFPSSSPVSTNPSNDARLRQSAIAHEAGHAFGLSHQSDYDRLGNKINEYSSGPDRLHGPIMGVDFAGDVHKWLIGHPSTSPVELQDDVSAMAARIALFGGGDGVRPDDVPGTFEQAAPLAGAAPGAWTASGIVERPDDIDAYSFAAPGGGGPLRIDLVLPAPSMLDGKLEIYRADGTLIAAADGPANDQHLLFPTLPAGTYYALVRSHGDYADLGPYDLTVSEAGGPPAPGPTPEYNNLPPPQGLALTAGGGTSVAARWDAVPGATGYAIDRSDDGVAWGQVAVTGEDDRSFEDAGLPTGGHRYFYRVSALDAAGRSEPSGARNLVNRPAAPTGLDVTSYRESALVLNWRDTGGETGYRVERRATAAYGSVGPWEGVGAVGPNVPSWADTSASPAAEYSYRVTATSPSGDSAPAQVSATMVPVSVKGLRAAVRLPTELGLAWDPIYGATYSLERSSDGSPFQPLATVTTPAYRDEGVEPFRRYSYRVVATTPAGVTVSSAVLAVATPSDVPLPDGWRAADVGVAFSGAPEGSVQFDPAGTALAALAGGAGLSDVSPVDSFFFVYRELDNVSVIAHVATQDHAQTGAFAGVMVRDGTTPDAPYAFAGVSTPYGASTEVRIAPGYPNARFTIESSEPAPKSWVRLERRGGTVVMFGSADGTSWEPWGSADISFPSGPVLVGVAVAAGRGSDLSSAAFDNVRIVEDATPIVPAPTARQRPGDPWVFDLSASAKNGGSEQSLTYTWSVVDAPAGAAVPVFSDNGTNGAGNVAATFSASGRYVLRVRATDPQGRSGSADVTVNVPPQPSKIIVSPLGRVIRASGGVQFSALTFDELGRETREFKVTWSALRGRINASGFYIAPSSSTWDTVTATVGDLSESVDIYAYGNSDGSAVLSAVSSKVHGSGTLTYDLPVTLFGGPPTVEPRLGGPTTLRFTFSGAVFALDRVLDANDFDITGATFRAASIAGNVLTVQLSDIKDGSVVRVGFGRLVNFTGKPVQGPTHVDIAARLGDVNRSGTVNAADLLLLRKVVAHHLNNLVCDIDLSGRVTPGDIILARRGLARVFA
jgi:hypothetical protein